MLLELIAVAALLQAGASSTDPCDPALRAQHEADMVVADAALKDLRPSRRSALEAIIARAPMRPWPKYELCGSTLLVHSEEAGDLMIGLAAVKPAPGQKIGAVFDPMPFALAALIIGSLDDSAGRYEQALRTMDSVGRLDPADPSLAAERAYALSSLGRNSEALTVVDAALEANIVLGDLQKGQLLRKRGYALGELERWDEGIAAYRAALKIDPKDRIASNELRYLEGRRGGGGSKPVGVTTSDKKHEDPTFTPPPVAR